MEEALRTGIETVGTNTERERRLVEAAVAGDVLAFAALYDRHLERVYRYTYYLVGNRADAEDLTQQVFLKAWEAIRRYRHTQASFASWLLRIAHNLAMTFFRRSRETGQLDTMEQHAGAHGDPEAEALASQDRWALRQALQKLRPEYRAVVVMRMIERMQYPEIALAIGKSEGNVRVIQHRALGELRRLLENEVER